MSYYRVDLFRDDKKWKSLFVEAESKRKAMYAVSELNFRDMAVAHWHLINEVSKHEYMEAI